MCLVKIILCGFILLNMTVFLNTTSERLIGKIQVLTKDSAKEDSRVAFERNLEVGKSEDFTTFLSTVNVVIDRSMFIEFVINNFANTNKRFIITSPSRWGKTTLQRMLQFFFSIQLNNNLEVIKREETDAYKYFHEGKINVNGECHKFDKKPLLFQKTTNKAKLEEHIANHPVIIIDFVSAYQRGMTAENYKKMLQIQISQKYDFYKRKFDIICSQKNTVLCNLREKAVNLQLNPVQALKTLTKLLYIAYQERKIVLLLDKYETIILENYIPNNLNSKEAEVLKIDPKCEVLYRGFMLSFLKETSMEPTMYLFVYITGILPISFDGASGTNVKFENYLSPELTHFFGIDNKTANELMDVAKFNKTTKHRIDSICDGYKTPYYTNVTMYNPYSLLELLHEPEKSHPWFRKSRFRFLSKAILPNNKGAIKKLILLVGGECIEYSYNCINSFAYSDLSILKAHILYWQNDPLHEKFLQYLLYMGILTLSTTDKDKTGPWTLQTVNRQMKQCVKIPNQENRLIIEDHLQIGAIKELDVIETSEMLASILSDPKTSLNHFEERVQSFMADGYSTQNLIHGSELFFHGLFFFDIVRYLAERYNYTYFLDYKFLNLKEHKTPDIVVLNNTYGAVFEIKYNNKPQQIKEAKKGQLREYGLLFHKAYPKIENLRLILIHVKESKERTIKVEATGLDPITSEKDFIKLQEDFNSYNKIKEPKNNNLNMAKEDKDQPQIPNIETKDSKP